MFFTDELLREIDTESNRCAKDTINKMRPLPIKLIWCIWKEINLLELKAFLEIIVNLGTQSKPDIDRYFSTNWSENLPFFKVLFSIQRFLQIFWYLHLFSPPNRPILGVLPCSAKVKNVVTYPDMNFEGYYCPGSKVSVDKSTVGFKCKVLFKCYIIKIHLNSSGI